MPGHVCTCVNISGRCRTNEVLLPAWSRYRSGFLSVRCYFVAGDPAGQFDTASVLGYTQRVNNEALCVSHPEVKFFAEGDGRLSKKQKQAAIDLCWKCPVRENCLKDNLGRENHGVILGGFFFNDSDEVYSGGRRINKADLLAHPKPERYRGT